MNEGKDCQARNPVFRSGGERDPVTGQIPVMPRTTLSATWRVLFVQAGVISDCLTHQMRRQKQQELSQLGCASESIARHAHYNEAKGAFSGKQQVYYMTTPAEDAVVGVAGGDPKNPRGFCPAYSKLEAPQITAVVNMLIPDLPLQEGMVAEAVKACPSFEAQEDQRLFQATGGLKAIRCQCEMTIRMLASRPLNVATGKLDRASKPIYQLLMEGGHDNGLFSNENSPFQLPSFMEVVQLMKPTQEAEDEELVLTPSHTNPYNDALRTVVVPRLDLLQQTAGLCLQHTSQCLQQTSQSLEQTSRVTKWLIDREIKRDKMDKLLLRQNKSVLRQIKKLNNKKRRHKHKEKKKQERELMAVLIEADRMDLLDEESSSSSESSSSGSDDDIDMLVADPTNSDAVPLVSPTQLTHAAPSNGGEILVQDTRHMPLKRKRNGVVKERERQVKVSRNADSTVWLKFPGNFDDLWECYFVGAGCNQSFRHLERKGQETIKISKGRTPEWRKDVRRFDNEGGKKVHARSNWWNVLHVYFNCFEFLLAGTRHGWDDERKESGAGAGLSMEDAKKVARQIWESSGGDSGSVHKNRKQFVFEFQRKLGEYSEYNKVEWKLHGTIPYTKLP
jgi:hypothetical protein